MKRLALIPLLATPALAQTVTDPRPVALVCAYNSAIPSPANGQYFFVQCDSTGKLITSFGGTVAPANGGTGTSTVFTTGSVVFSGASGIYSQDNANFFWDATNHRLGIGTSTPSGNLYISRTGTFEAAVPALGAPSLYFNLTAASTYGLIAGVLSSGDVYLQSQAVDTTAAAYNMLLQPNGGKIGIGVVPTHPLDMASGAFVSAGGVWTNASDRRLKTNIKPLTYGLPEVLKLNPVSYTFKADNSRQIGFIAQEVREVMPELVTGDESGGKLGLSYGQLNAALVNAVKELTARVKKLEAKK